MTIATPTLSPPDTRGITIALFLTGSAWALAVAVLADRGVFLAMPMPAIALLVAVGILVLTAAYFFSRRLQGYIEEIGLYALTVLHIWRIPAALAFFVYGLAGQLPTLFWVLAGVGDLVAGLYAWKLAVSKPDAAAYLRFHLFGFADFVVAVGTGLTFTLLQDPKMATIAVLPLVLIPLFGVGISGATHLIAFDQLRRSRRLPSSAMPPTEHQSAMRSGRR